MSWNTVTTGSFQAPGSSSEDELSTEAARNLAADRQAEAGPLFLALGGEEGLEQALANRLGDTRPVVGDLDDREPRVVRLHAGAHLDHGARRAGDGVERVRQQVDEDLLQRVWRSPPAAGTSGAIWVRRVVLVLRSAKLEQRRHPHQHLAQLAAPLAVCAAGIDRWRRFATSVVSRSDCSTMWRAKSSTSSSSTRSFSRRSCAEALDREQRLAELVDLLGGEAAELGQAAGRRQQLAQPAKPPRATARARGLVGRGVRAVGHGEVTFPQVGRLWLQCRGRAAPAQRSWTPGACDRQVLRLDLDRRLPDAAAARRR